MPPAHHTGRAAPDSPERARQIEAEQVTLLYGQALSSQVVGVLNVALVALVLWNVAARGALLGWAGLMVLIATGRSLLVLAYRRARPAEDQTRPWRTRFVIGTGAAGIGWGLAGVVLFPVIPLVHQVFLIYVLGGMAVGAAALMSPVLAAYWAFLPAITLPIMGQLLLRDDLISVAMGIMFTVCTVMFMNAARQMHASMTDSIRLRFENLDLVQSLSVAKAQTEAVNRSLQVEIGERRRAQEQLTASLREKEVLLTEIHHRVKNNLQVISSLLSLQSRALTSPEALSAFTDSQNRVRSMALVHEKLYQSPDLARIDFAAYVRELASHLFRVYRSTAEAIPLHVNARDVFLTIERAVPCGLIVSEILSNALKYAFPGGRRGEIAIDLLPEEDARYRITIRDNGVGLPPNVDFRHTTSLGLRIVNTLTEQLGGTIHLANNGGAAFTLTFPIEDVDDSEAPRAHPNPGR
jgi:two-component sensor histidine kinase